MSSIRPQAGSSDTLGMGDSESQLRTTESRDLSSEFGFDSPEHGQADQLMSCDDNQQQPEDITVFDWEQEHTEINQFFRMDGLDADSYPLPEPNAIRAHADILSVDDLGSDISLVDIDDLFSGEGEGAHEGTPVSDIELYAGAVGDLDKACPGEGPTNESFPNVPAAMNDGISVNSANLSKTFPVKPSGVPAVLSGAHGTQPEATLPPQHPAGPEPPCSKGRGRQKKSASKATAAKPSSTRIGEQTSRKRPTPKKARAKAAVKNQDVSPSESTVISGVEASQVSELPGDDGKGWPVVEDNKENECPNLKREGSPFTAESNPGPREAKRLCGAPSTFPEEAKTTTAASQINQTEIQPENPSGQCSGPIDTGDTLPSKNDGPAQREVQLRRSTRVRKSIGQSLGNVK
ncbi:hypothetical protein VTN77DRAFT_3244 [Rasamsonia byssochlamydoides]|uniref:uncharacterized protein n=1 Tax=Rasamsonia byssochlamydoides TaxID=89139 RepID=UPI0037439895